LKRDMTEQEKQGQRAASLARVQRALDQIQEAQNLLDRAAEDLCPIVGLARAYARVQRQREAVHKLWYEVLRVARRPTLRLDRDPTPQDMALAEGTRWLNVRWRCVLSVSRDEMRCVAARHLKSNDGVRVALAMFVNALIAELEQLEGAAPTPVQFCGAKPPGAIPDEACRRPKGHTGKHCPIEGCDADHDGGAS